MSSRDPHPRTGGRLRTAAAVAAAWLLATGGLTAAAQADPGDGADRAPQADGADLAAVWTPTNAPVRASLAGHRATVLPTESLSYDLDDAGIQEILEAAPAEGPGVAGSLISLPAPDGTMVDFRIVESSVMESELAARHPEIRTYIGQSVADPATTVALDHTTLGFHAAVRGPAGQGSWLIDPGYVGDQSVYRTYSTSAVPAPQQPLVEPELDGAARTAYDGADTDRTAPPGSAVELRTYRLALLTDPTYADYFGTENVLSAKATLMSRVNQIYSSDVAVRMVLIDDTEKLNLDTPEKAMAAHGPCGATACFNTAQLDPAATTTNGCTGGLLTRTRFVIGQLVGAHSFDIGHIGLGLNGGGIASLGVVGGNNKAQGCTGIPTPTGDFYAIDYVAHELGHQFGGNHTFNGNQVNCSGGNRNGGTSVEPGSGSSVMAYAGICVNDDLQPHTDPYFSQRTQTEINAVISDTPNQVNEQQQVALDGFDTAGETFTLDFPGLGTTAPITRGTNFTSAGVKAAIEAVTGSTVSVGTYFSGSGAPSDSGFTVSYSGALAGTDVPNPVLQVVSGDFTGFANDIAQGGPGTNGGSTVEETANHTPYVEAPAARYLPARTPFTLTGSGSDVDGDRLVYLWEQNDRGDSATRLVSNAKANGPLFRVFGDYADVSPSGTIEYESPGENLAGESPSRTFPDLEQVLAGDTNAATGECPQPVASDFQDGQPTRTLSDGSVVDNRLVDGPVLDCYSEFLPTGDYRGAAAAGNADPSLDFRLTARDQVPGGGGTQYADVKLRIDPTAGPLLVTSQSDEGETVTGGTTDTVTWAVNGTDRDALAPRVDIALSVDGGYTYPYTLASGTPNDGTQDVVWPDVDAAQARVRVQAHDNYFFAVNGADFAITEAPAPETPSFTVTGPSGATSVVYSDPAPAGLAVDATAGSTEAAAALTASATGLPDGLRLTGPATTPGSTSARWSVAGSVTDEPGTYDAVVTVADQTSVRSVVVPILVTPEAAEVTYTGPTRVTPTDDRAVAKLSAQVREDQDGSAGDLTTASVRFESGDDVLCEAPVSAAGSASCEATLAVDAGTVPLDVAVTGTYTGKTTAELSVGADHEPPATRITNGPADRGFLLSDAVTFGLAADEPGGTFECSLDGRDRGCGPLAGLTHRTHVFEAAARDTAGNLDPTPERRRFAVPLGDDQLRDPASAWKRRSGAAAYLGSYSTATTAGATLRRSVTGAERLMLVVGRGEGFGRVKVYLDGRLLKTVSLDGEARARVAVPLATFNSPRSGVVTIVSQSGRKVRVEGLGVLTR